MQSHDDIGTMLFVDGTVASLLKRFKYLVLAMIFVNESSLL